MKNYQYLVCSILFVLALQQLMAQQVLPFNSAEGSAKLTNDDTDRVFVYGIGGAESLDLKQLTASGTLTTGILLTEDGKLTANLTFNFGATAVKKESADSVPLSVFYFPDVANTAFSAGLEYSFDLNEESMVSPFIEGSIQRRNIKKDSLIYDFGIVNSNVGLKYRWNYEANDHKAIFTAGLCYNYVAINRNNTDAFNSLFNNYVAPQEASIKRYFGGVSLMASVQLDDAIVFARTYDDVNRRGTIAFTVGIKAAATFFSF